MRRLSKTASRERVHTLHTMGYHTERVRLPNGDIAVLKSRPSNYPKDSAGWSAASLLALGVGIYYLTKFALSYADASVNRDLHQNA